MICGTLKKNPILCDLCGEYMEGELSLKIHKIRKQFIQFLLFKKYIFRFFWKKLKIIFK